MAAWAKALDELGESDKARHLAARLKEFRSDAEDEFLAVCRTTPLKLTAPRRAEGTTSPAAWPADRAASTAPRRAEGSPSTAESASTLEAAPGGSASAIPFQCLAPAREYRFEDFRRR